MTSKNVFQINETESNEENDLKTSKYFRPGSVFGTKVDTNSSTNSSSTNSSSTNLLESRQEQNEINVNSLEANSLSSASTSKEPPEASVPESNEDKTCFTSITTNMKRRNMNACILVNPNQSANKLLKFLRVPYEFDRSIGAAHYVMFPSCCALFLSLKYHHIYPQYIYDQLDSLQNSYQLKVLLILVDHIEYKASLKELTKLAIRTNCTLMLAWSPEEAASYIVNYKNFAEKPPDFIMGKQTANNEGSHDSVYQCMIEALTTIKSINRTDAVSLISLFDSLENIVKSDEDQLIICPGLAKQKVDRIREFFNRPFIRDK